MKYSKIFGHKNHLGYFYDRYFKKSVNLLFDLPSLKDLAKRASVKFNQGYYKAHWIDRRNFFQNDLCPTNKRPSQNNSNLL